MSGYASSTLTALVLIKLELYIMLCAAIVARTCSSVCASERECAPLATLVFAHPTTQLDVQRKRWQRWASNKDQPSHRWGEKSA